MSYYAWHDNAGPVFRLTVPRRRLKKNVSLNQQLLDEIVVKVLATRVLTLFNVHTYFAISV